MTESTLYVWDHALDVVHILGYHDDQGYPLVLCGADLHAKPINWCSDPAVCNKPRHFTMSQKKVCSACEAQAG